jgi:hypothetical protein
LVTLLVSLAMRHDVEAMFREATSLAMSHDIGGAGVDVARSDHRSGLPAAADLLPRPLLDLVLILVIVIVPRSVLVVHAQAVEGSTRRPERGE